MLDYFLVETLQVVIQSGTFQKAANLLRITQSAVSQRIQLLEQQFGQPLLVRTSPPALTQAGRELVRHYEQVALLQDSFLNEMKSKLANKKPVILRLAVNTESLVSWFVDAITPLMKRTRLLVAIHRADQDETIKLLREGAVLACVSTLAKPLPGCVSTRLGKMLYRCVASNDFIEKYFQRGIDACSLQEAPAAIFDEADRLHDIFLTSRLRTTRLPAIPYTYVPSPEGLVRFAVEGLAYSILPSFLVDPHLKSGRLTDLFPQRPYRMRFYWHSVDWLVPTIQQLSDEITKHTKQMLEQ
ncbi:MAG: ArgP/LysG family DNA-binding transcriptional regulator [Deltaproteobacteria bacterium]|nr:ArgP/LysG family DNA-binding transcriptional regulator [Deltaproteobacteria bacterium]